LNTSKPPSIDLFPSSLLLESQKTLEEQFTKLPHKIQTGYTLVFWNHSGRIRHNTHNRRADSFPMDNNEVNRYFTDPRDFRAVNDNGYFLRPKYSRHGAIEESYVLSRTKVEGSVRYEPTKWIIKTIEAFQGWAEAGVIGVKNGYILDPEVKCFIDAWLESDLRVNRELVNHKGDSANEIAKYYGGAIHRNLSKVTKRININVQIKLNIESLLLHKEQLNYTLRILSQSNTKTISKGSTQWKDIVTKLEQIEGEGEAARERESNVQALGGVKVKNNHSKSLKSLAMKGFTSIRINERLVEINKLLATAREQGSNTIPIFYEEAKTGRYTAKNAILQGFHKSVRYAALKGCYEYDLNAAHQNILIQLLEREGVDFLELEVVRDYVKNKQKIRIELAKTLDAPIEIIKEIIQALTYGAQLTRNKKQSIYEICEGDEKLVERVIKNPWLEQLAKTFLIAHKHLVGNKKILKNAVGIKSESLSKKAEAMAHILQGCERLVLDALIKHSKPKDIALLVHDCIVYYTPKNTHDLSMIVLEVTGFTLEFSEEPY